MGNIDADPPASDDPGRNGRLHHEALCRVIDAAALAAREHGADALGWRWGMLAEFAILASNTLRRVLNDWRGRA